MKKLLNPALASIALAVFTVLCVGQTVQQQRTSKETAVKAENADKLIAEAIKSSIITLKGKEFPLIAKGSGSNSVTASGPCELYDTRTFSHVAAIDLESPYHVSKSNSYPSSPPQQALFSSPDPNFSIASYTRIVTSTGPPYQAADSAFPAGYSFLTSSDYSSVKTTMHSFVGSLNISPKIKADLNAKIDTLISNTSAYTYSVRASNATVQHTATVWGTGVFNTTAGHSWYHGYINGTLICTPAYLHDQNLLTARLKDWVKLVLSKLPQLMTHDAEKN